MRLNRKILLLTISILALSLLVSSAVTVRSFRNNYTEALLTGGFGIGHSINDVLSEMLALGLPLDSLSGMDRRLARVVNENPHIAYAGIADLAGSTLFHSHPRLVGRRFDDEVMRRSVQSQAPLWQLYRRFDGHDYYDVSVPVFDADDAHVGVVRLGFPIRVVDDKVLEAVTHILLNVLGTFAVIALLLNLVLRRVVSQPVSQLSAYAGRIADGDYDHPVRIRSGDEVGQLSASLIRMADSLRRHIDALEGSREQLEQQVEERTRELEGANATLQARNASLTEAIARERALVEQTRRSERALRESEERFRRMFEDSGDALFLLEGHRYVECNQTCLGMLGYTAPSQLIGRHPGDISPPRQADHSDSYLRAEEWIDKALKVGSTRFEWQHRRNNGEAFPTEVLLTPIDYSGRRLIHVVLRDITERKEAEAQIHSLAFYDPLTSLANRRLFLDRLQRARAINDRTENHGALMLLDLDHFKTLNDTQGHDAGDQLLVQVGERLQRCVRGHDTVARLGGDEFVVMVEGLGDDRVRAAQSAEQVAETVRNALDQPYLLQGQSEGYHISCSVGVTLFHGAGGESVEVLLKHADLALYRAKEAGRDAIRFFDPQMQARVDARAQLEKELHRAVRDQEFILHYQPQVDVGGRLLGVEALLRWSRAGGLSISPDEFIPLAEENGLILPLGYVVLEQACACIAAWSQGAGARLTVAANVSPRQLHHPDFVERVIEIVSASGIDPGRLKLEITESAVLGNLDEAAARMTALRDAGMQFSLDDFGTGYASLSNLKRLPIAQVKIDRSFVRDIIDDPNDAAIVRAILGMTRSLDMEVIAEGVESSAQRDFLVDNGCRVFQGYLYGRPMPLAQLDDLIAAGEYPIATTPKPLRLGLA